MQIFYNTTFGDEVLQEGLYKVEFYTVHGTGTGVIYAINGKLRGGNSAFAFIGNYAARGDGVHVKVTTQRHNPDPAFKPLFGTDMITLTLKGADDGNMVDFEGTALQLPGVNFKATLTRISD
jgi:hypothetical protein